MSYLNQPQTISRADTKNIAPPPLPLPNNFNGKLFLFFLINLCTNRQLLGDYNPQCLNLDLELKVKPFIVLYAKILWQRKLNTKVALRLI